MNLQMLLRRLDREIEKEKAPQEGEGVKLFFLEVLRHTHSYTNSTAADFIMNFNKLADLLSPEMKQKVRRLILKASRKEVKA